MKKIKKLLNILPKKTIALLMAFAMLASYVLPITNVLADGQYIITFSAQTGHSMTIEEGHLKIDGRYVDLKNGDNNIGAIECEDTTSCSITVSDGTAGVLNYNGTDKFTLYNTNGHTKYNMGTSLSSNEVFNVEDYENPDSTGRNTTANITVSAGDGSYMLRGNNVNYDDEVEISINGSRWDHSNTIQYNAENSDTTVTFTFETLWINRFYDNIVINGTSYTVSDYLDFDDRTEWLIANHGTQALAFDIPNVAKADSYNVVVKHGENNGSKYLATFLWTADPNQANGEDYIGNSKLEFVKAVYEVGGTKYTVKEEDLEGKLKREGEHLNANSIDGFLSYGVTADVDYDDGSLTLPGGAEVTMRVVPKYGYQVTSVNGGENFKTTSSGVSEFTVTVAEGTAGYFRATVEKVDDEVLSNSDKVSSGSIKIENSEIDAGTVRLSVDDVDLTTDKIKEFETFASEKGNYEINSYLDINLNQVLYKGTSNDVWSNQIHHLKNKALITLKLEDGVDVNNIVIVHNIDDGDEFEIIEIESYDEETNTITFYTDSFSNYAIATKTSSSSNVSSVSTSNPKTNDNIMMYALMLILSIVGLVGTRIYTKKVN